MSEQKTWADVEQAALHEPVLQAVVAIVAGGASREDALIAGALLLASDVAALRHDLVAAIAGAPSNPPRLAKRRPCGRFVAMRHVNRWTSDICVNCYRKESEHG